MNPKSDIKIELKQVRLDILQGIRECSDRGLMQTTKWLSELNFALKENTINYDDLQKDRDLLPPEEREGYQLAKSYFDCQEYDRAAHYLEHCTSQKSLFLLKYSQYLSSEKKKLDNRVDLGAENPESTQTLLDLLSYFKANGNNLDGYLLYLQGIVLKKLDLRTQAVSVLQAAVTATPILWSAWVELAGLANEADALDFKLLPQHWMMNFFAGHAFVELKLSEQAIEAYLALEDAGFHKSTYVIAQMAIAHHDRRDVDSSLALFRDLFEADPCRIDNWDVYSHLLYLKDKTTELANLAHRAVAIDKYRVETCCVIGNYHSLRSEHHKAVLSFQRALALDPQYLSAWILMGHEFIELQNANAAIHCYRQAVDVNRNDYRAWNGLGQAYEILGLNGYCIYYYSRAAQLKPDDSRMLVSLGEAYEKMDKIPNALKCYFKAHSTGDIEGMALFKMAKLYDKSNMPNSAAAAHTAAAQDPANQASPELPAAQRYLAEYYLRFSLLDHAAHYAYKCLDNESTKEAGKSILKTISEKRLSAPASQPTLPEDIPEAIKSCAQASLAGTPEPNIPNTSNMENTPNLQNTPSVSNMPNTPIMADTPHMVDTPNLLNMPSMVDTPNMPSPDVTPSPESFSTPVFTRRGKYKM